MVPWLHKAKPADVSLGRDIRALGDAVVLTEASRVPKIGPKYSNHHQLHNVELLSLVRTVASKANGDEVTKCIRESVDTLPKDLMPGPSERTNSAVKALRDADEKLLQASKEGGFVVVPGPIYKEKADATITWQMTPPMPVG